MDTRGFYGVRYFSKGIFPGGSSQVTISKMCNFQSGNFPMVRLGLWGAPGYNEDRALRLGWARGPNAAARTC